MPAIGARRAKTSESSRGAENDNVHDLMLELRRDLESLLSPKQQELRTIAQLAKEWLPRKLLTIPASADSFEPRVKNRIIPALGHHTASTLKKRDVETFLQELAANGLSPQSVNHVRDAGRQLVEDAIDNDEWPASNPFARSKTLKIPERDYEVLSRKETCCLLRAVGKKWKPLFATAIYLGPRRKTLFWIQPKEVDLEAEVISFNQTKTGKRIKRVPIPAELLPYLKQAMKGATSRAWLFVNREGNRHSRYSKALNRVLRNALKDAGIRRENGHIPKITFHGLRRVSSILHQEAGCHPWVVSKVLGHSQASLAMFGSVTENMTAKKYTVFSEEFVRKQLNLLSLK